MLGCVVVEEHGETRTQAIVQGGGGGGRGAKEHRVEDTEGCSREEQDHESHTFRPSTRHHASGLGGRLLLPPLSDVVATSCTGGAWCSASSFA